MARISATGTRGFTLVEILVVVAIAGIVLAVAAVPQPCLALIAFLAFVAVRCVHFWRLTSDLRLGERLAALPLGLASDAIYSAAFNSGVVLWVLRGKSLFSSARRAAGAVAPRA